MTTSDYSKHLQAYVAFAHQPARDDLRFAYSDRHAPQLVELNTTYALDRVCGDGDTWSKTTRLMDWTFGQLHGVGTRMDPQPRHSLNILAHRGKGSLFCIHKSIVLNEALLSVGVTSRLLWCYPRTFDSDCHVVVLVYVPELGKWTILDPTFATYIHSADGTPLSVLEIRDAFARDESPSFRHIAIRKEWTLVMNGDTCETYDEFYRLYIAKNCFRFSSPLCSRYGCATDPGIARVFLNPLGFESRNEYDQSPVNPSLSIYTYSADDFFRTP